MDDAEQGAERANVSVEGSSVVVEAGDGRREFELCTLPEAYMDWIDKGRRSMYAQLKGAGEPVRFFAQHLPVLVTYSEGKPFPFNCCNKGVGFIPKERYLSECIELFHATLRDTRDKPWQESLARRLDVASRFFFDREKIDARAISTLEIFQKNTFRNLLRTPLASLLFTGEFPSYTSFQLNCAVEVLGPDDPRHTFILLARSLFEHDAFHIAQPRFNYAYVFWLTEVLDKTPVRVQAHPADMVETEGDLAWHPDALTAIGRAPGMIQSHIRSQIETYARARGVTEVSVELVQQARDELMTPGRAAAPERANTIGTYRRLYVCLDGSELSNAAMEMAVAIGRREGAELLGSHVYAAKLHDRRFRAMESGLPEQYQKEGELEEQREVHDSLITKGLELISDSYLEGMEAACLENGLSFRGISLEGRNWQELALDVERNDCDLIALGGHGVGRVAGALLGSVAERLLRRVKRDILLCKVDPQKNASDTIVVCLDGSVRSWGALQRGIQLARAFGKKLVAVSAFDPYFHYTMFSTLNRTLTDKAREVFKFEEQEKLHEDIIDSGLAKIYQSHLDIGRRIAADDGIELETHLLDGKAYEKILAFVRAAPPWLLILGRTGIHSDEEMDIGGHTENVCRQANCNLLIVDTRFEPPVEYQAAETVTWTTEAQAFMERVPAMARGVAMNAVQGHCIAEGHTVVTTSVLKEAVRRLLPRSAIERMGIDFDEEKGQSGKSLDRIDLSFRCTKCGHVHRGLRPRQCPVCGEAGSTFKLVESKQVEDAVVSTSMDGRELSWERAALDRLEAADPVLRRQLETRLEKQALTQRLSAITLEMVEAEYPSGERGPVWTEAAVVRLERAPAGFMRNAAKATVEKYARSGGIEEITLEVAEAGLAQARKTMAQALATGEAPTPAEPESSASSFECGMCGLVVDGARPDLCPACQTGGLRRMTRDERARASATATRVLSWDEDALLRMERIPAGFMRTMARCRVEQWARSNGRDRVSVDVVEAKYESWAAGSRGIECQLEWSPEALARLEKVPGFVRPMVAREIERNAEAAGHDQVDGSVLDGVLSRWGSLRTFHGERDPG